MKIGILTFHSQINYGGVLQCWALQTALEELGHEVVVIDRWLDADRKPLVGAYNLKQWIKFVVRVALGLGDYGLYRRRTKTERFLNKYLNLTPYHFLKWKDAPDTLGVDLIVVGSDQVWHCGDWGDPTVYLLEGAEKCNLPPVISYAASFGLREIPKDFIPLYKRGLSRFKAISCREREGVEICKGLGYEATHVVDPTLLVETTIWSKMFGSNFRNKNAKRRLVCYFMSVDVRKVLPSLIEFSKRMRCDVDILSNNSCVFGKPAKISDVIKNYRYDMCLGKVRLCRASDPMDFVRTFSNATWSLTDSFHAVMFSSIFECNARFIKPSSSSRAVMFARIEEFASSCVNGEFFVDDVEGALKSFRNGEAILYNRAKISQFRSDSLSWLKEAVGSKMV
jgi:hypothetical protein